jgi:hypothetical protein
VGLAVTDEDRAVAIDVDTVQSGQVALAWVSDGAVALGSGAGHPIDGPGVGIDPANAVAFSICQPNVSLFIDCDPFGAIEFGQLGWGPMSIETALAGACNVDVFTCFGIDPKNLIPFPCGQPHISVGIEIDRSGAFEGSSR